MSHPSARAVFKTFELQEDVLVPPPPRRVAIQIPYIRMVLLDSVTVSKREKPRSRSLLILSLQMVYGGPENEVTGLSRRKQDPPRWPWGSQPNLSVSIAAASSFFLWSVASEQEGFTAAQHDLRLWSPSPACCSCIRLQIWL